MDQFDYKILAALSADGRLSWTHLADQVNLSASACQRRVEALIKNDVIEKFTLAINPDALGLSIQALVSVNVERGDTQKAEELRTWLTQHPRVRSAYMVSGTIDYMLDVVATDLEDLARFLDTELLSMPAVRDATSSIVLKPIKSYQSTF